ncbi:Na(+)-translocating NADH-quinone reductase subunit C [Marinimicrobium agarilyticum]|uniref:Na(+)-translocating NADH-quinone reductase subunit C n=1 Tax=Marinimicrobium agarilyticum TaxID=306546 RepID=UPI000401AD2C|nr:Na(+)-translocating NADH-quinone reductase subunit C [Marinimicrobium agarilyticum]
MANNDTIKKTVTVTLLLCIVCSVVVSTAAVLLRPMQEANQELDFRSNILSAAGLQDVEGSVDEVFAKRVETRVVNLETGEFTDAKDPQSYDQWEAANDPSESLDLSQAQDIASIGRRENYAEVYMIRTPEGELQSVVLPVRGYGLWSTLYGFMAVKPDGNTVAGLTFYEHAETPGLGGEVDNPKWKSIWEGKQIYGEDGNVQLSVVKGSVDPSAPESQYKVDGLSGATLTSRGVDGLVEFWLGDLGFKSFLKNLREGEA